ncbi:hypothetical protein NHX12_022234 [Muraenolepis orangiensis]|uniref:SEC7 domain-containing protein n=1 Tax=Muraenolepis orangiensis TaxID=630683 RepID=A0A9Q0EMV1_9TELE|nr:hypothetical protein NHX12_022234 [Muraenolepis orangiensis]
MTQTGQVLHLYVEVRSLGQEEKGGGGDDDEKSDHRILHGPDLPPSRTFSPRPAHSPGPSRRPGISRDPSPTPSSPSAQRTLGYRHPGAPPGDPPYPQTQRCHGPDSLLQVLHPPETLPPRGDPRQGRDMLSVPPSSSPRRPSSRSLPEEEGRRSVVTFSYVQKANIQSLEHCGVRQAEPRPPFGSPEAGPGAAPVWVDTMPPQGDQEPDQVFSPWGQSPHGSPYHRRTAPDPLQTPEEAGSPDLRRRLACLGLGDRSPSLPREAESYGCRSWNGSPVLPRSTHTLPASAALRDPDPAGSRYWPRGPPRSPTLDRPSSPSSRYVYHQPAPDPQPTPQYSPPSWLGDESPRLSSRYRPLLPAGRPTDIQHQIPASSPSRTSYPASPTSRTSYHANNRESSGNWSNSGHNTAIPYNESNCMHHNARNSMHPSASSSPYRPAYIAPGYSSSASDASRQSCSPAGSPEVARRLALEASRLSPLFTDRRTPSPGDPSWPEVSPTGGLIQIVPQPRTSLHGGHAAASSQRSAEPAPDPAGPSVWPLSAQARLFPPGAPASPAHRPSAPPSPVLDPRNQHPLGPARSGPAPFCSTSSVSAPSSPAQHRLQPPQYRGEGGPRRLVSPREGTPRVGNPGPQWGSSTTNTEIHAGGPDPGYSLETRGGARTSPNMKNKEEEEDDDGGGEEQRRGGGGVSSSQSSSGVTGSVSGSGTSGWVSQTDVEGSLSPETSSQSSQRSCETPATPQSESVPDPTARSQKIAQAKWEFLFGVSTENHPTGGANTPLTPPHSLSLKLTNQQRGWEAEGQRLPHHEVQQIEVELVTVGPQHGSSPKTGIIRRTITYSETDLDAVPLRCYRETDLDEVMRSQVEEEAEEDSAFGSHRSTLGTSGSGGSPAHSAQRPQGKDLRLWAEPEPGKVEVEEEGVASWASVRMQGDRKRQEHDCASGLLTKRPAVWDGPPQLKSPLLPLSSPQLDSFSRHFESIVESHRAKGTSYSSLDSVDLLLTPGTPHVFTFDLPTLTPHIQTQLREGGRQKLDLCFASLVKPVLSGPEETSRFDGAGLNGGGAKDDLIPRLHQRWERESWQRANSRDDFHKASSDPSLHSGPRECNTAPPPPELVKPQADVGERLAQGAGDPLLNGTKADLQAAKRLAKRLYNLDGFPEEYLSYYNFTGLSIDRALRVFLKEFSLKGETQERERVLCHFSKRFLQCNPGATPNEDLHGPNIGKRMSCGQFVSNLEGLNAGKDFPKEQLKTETAGRGERRGVGKWRHGTEDKLESRREQTVVFAETDGGTTTDDSGCPSAPLAVEQQDSLSLQSSPLSFSSGGVRPSVGSRSLLRWTEKASQLQSDRERSPASSSARTGPSVSPFMKRNGGSDIGMNLGSGRSSHPSLCSTDRTLSQKSPPFSF